MQRLSAVLIFALTVFSANFSLAQTTAPSATPTTATQPSVLPPSHPPVTNSGQMGGGHGMDHKMCGGDQMSCGGEHMSCCGHGMYGQGHGQWTFTFSPSYFHQNRKNANAAFTTNGFSEPRQDLFGYEFEVRKQLDSGFQWGVEALGADTNREQGTNRANYSTGLFGLYVGYRALNTNKFSLDVGTGIGGARSELEVFSGTQNGRLEENAWYAQPTIGVAYTVSRNLRVGLSGSYLLPFGQDEEIVGQDLVVRDIALQGFSAKLDLILGRF